MGPPSGNAMVAAKSRMSRTASSPKMALNLAMAAVLFALTRPSNLSTMLFILATQSEGANF